MVGSHSWTPVSTSRDVKLFRLGEATAAVAHAASGVGARALPCDHRTADSLCPLRADEHLAARGLLRLLLAAAVDTDAARVAIASLQRGRPALVDRPDVCISLSHSHGWVAAAVRRHGAVGVDVQAPVKVSDRMVRRCCTPAATAALAALPDGQRLVEFAWLWSAGEACAKATGIGLVGVPKLAMNVAQPRGTSGLVSWASLRGRSPVPLSCAVLDGSLGEVS